MNIEILNDKPEVLRQKVHSIYKEQETDRETELKHEVVSNIKNILSDREIKEMFADMQNPFFYKKLSYEKLAKLEEASRILNESLSDIKTTVDLEKFLEKGYNLDIKGLKDKYRKRRLDKEFPDLNFKRIRELYLIPPKRLTTYYSDKVSIQIDDYVFRKYLIAVLQMVFNHMDIVICNIGDEGAGKSCKCSQDMYILWWMMTEIGLINYGYDINELFANTLNKFMELEDKYYGHPFRIVGLDEGNELNRQDWKEDNVKLFWQRLRRERHERRIKFINIPVLGEMIINIVLSRVNFIFNMINKNETETGTLYKGDYEFYIVPRGEKIYSPYHKREISKEEIKNKLYSTLKDKEYLKGIPKEIMVKLCHCNGVWGFKESDYIKEMKETNKQYTITKGIKFGKTELYSFYKANVTLKKLGIKKNSVYYPSINLMIHKIKKFWNNNPELLLKMDVVTKQKVEEKENDEEN